jgi:acetyl-CoA carboxylase carboxyl transferase subunit beta
MSSFQKIKTPGIKQKDGHEKNTRVPDGMWLKCAGCEAVLETKAVRDNHWICIECGHHYRMNARERIDHLTGGAVFKEYGQDLRSNDPLKFEDMKPYAQRLTDSIEKMGVNDAFLCGRSQIGAIAVNIGAFEFKFMGGSMGTVVGEKVTLVFENALKDKSPAIVVSASGGARMQESILSLMQMAKTSAYVLEMRNANLPFISILTDPTTGGVAASFAMLGDIILAEPKALIGFAGPRVIEQTMRQKLPEGFQRSEFLLKQGFIDQVVPREQLPSRVETLLTILLANKHSVPAKVAKRKKS